MNGSFNLKKDKMKKCERIFHKFVFPIHAYVIRVASYAISYTFNFTLPNEALGFGAERLLRLVLWKK